MFLVTGCVPTPLLVAQPWPSTSRRVLLHPGATVPPISSTRCDIGSRPNAHGLFVYKPELDVHEWTTLICELSREGRFCEALSSFRKMVEEQWKPNGFSLSVVLGCCTSLGAIEIGREVHGFMVRNAGRQRDQLYSDSSLVNFYAKCGYTSLARSVFDRMPEKDVVSWTIMLKSYANQRGFENEMLGLFEKMTWSGIDPNQYTLTTVLSQATLDLGEQLHCQSIKRRWHPEAFVGSALVDMYSKNGDLCSARLVFDRIEEKDVVCYNSLISAFGRTGEGEGLVSTLNEMELVGLVATQSTYVGVLNGCANLGLVSLSRCFHARVIVTGFLSDEIIAGTVVDMHAKCGNLGAARAAFNGSSGDKRSVGIWNSMISGYGKHGLIKEALRVFNLMEIEGVLPDYITFICLLSACSHSGLIAEGWRLYIRMQEVYRIPPRNEHYCCMVDLMGRAGMIDEAYEFICGMQIEVGASVWGALLTACRVWDDANIGSIAARRLIELEPDCSASYVALACIFAARRRWDESNAIRELMDGCEIRKEAGYSCIETNGELHKFRAGDPSGNPRMDETRAICRTLNSCMREPICFETVAGLEDDGFQSTWMPP